MCPISKSMSNKAFNQELINNYFLEIKAVIEDNSIDFNSHKAFCDSFHTSTESNSFTSTVGRSFIWTVISKFIFINQGVID